MNDSLAKVEQPIIAIASPDVTIESKHQNSTWLSSCCGNCRRRNVVDEESGPVDQQAPCNNNPSGCKDEKAQSPESSGIKGTAKASVGPMESSSGQASKKIGPVQVHPE